MDVTGSGATRVDLAFHEAGHAVAAVLRGLGWDATIDAAGSVEALDRRACDLPEVPEQVRAFVAYAGVWAVSRQRWVEGGGLLEDSRGRTFDDYMGEALLVLPADAMTVAMAEYEIAALLRDGGADEQACWRWLRGVHYAWRGELEDVWGVVEWVATHLLEGSEVRGYDIVRLTDERLADLYS